MFRDMDVDKGGTIDFGEFKDWYENNTDGEILKRVKGAMGNDKKSMKRRQPNCGANIANARASPFPTPLPSRPRIGFAPHSTTAPQGGAQHYVAAWR